jgi:hypothetical protein
MGVCNDWLPVGSAQKMSVGQQGGEGGLETLCPQHVPSSIRDKPLPLSHKEGEGQNF